MARRKSRKQQDKLFGSIVTKIVGIQYYDGEVKPGEEVHFEREPDNQYDANST